MSRILVVEDEERISAFVAKGLRAAGFEPHIARTGTEAIVALANAHFDLVILDLGLPQMDGFEVLQKVRSTGNAVPVIILTARSSVEDTVQGLSSGAQDYMAKPFRVEELVARVRLRLRPDPQAPSGPEEVTELEHAGLRLDLPSRQASVDGRAVELSAREFTLAEVLLEHPRQVLSRDQLLDMVWESSSETSSNVVDVYIRYLRAKLGAERIVTVRGAGYRLATAEELARR
ncbi:MULTISPECIES: response regulator transcription factor [Actinomycetes]|uniref:Response regulator transcription factor n=2 Tax=Actinomycetes TaxID=1760 RepID=A0ABP6M1Z1_9MICC|nr:response regulator transcription factor [Nesterenkonia sp. CL21]MDS2173854.1 response regulator transcription factor [Nesterenkonia sp. CL21]